MPFFGNGNDERPCVLLRYVAICRYDLSHFNRSKARQDFASLIHPFGDADAAKMAPHDAFEQVAS